MGRVKQTARKSIVAGASKAPRMQRAQKGTKAYPMSAVRPKPGGAPRKHRFHPGTVSLREIRYYQKTTGTLAAKAPIERQLRRLAADGNGGNPVRFRGKAVVMIQAMLEHHLTAKLHRGYQVTLHAKRKNLIAKDIELVGKLEGPTELPPPIPSGTQ